MERKFGFSTRTTLLCISKFFLKNTIMVKNQNDPLENLAQIRSLMERSSRFISLSGLSGVAAGTVALIGAAVAYIYFGLPVFSGKNEYYFEVIKNGNWGMDYVTFFLLDAAAVFVLALAGGIYFTTRKARKKGYKIWDALSQRMLVNLAIPLVAGGIFCIALFKNGAFGLIAPATLIFYGLALVNGGKYTLNDIRYLGLLEIGLGFIGLFKPGYGLELWALGFGVAHIVYGIIMYNKYERN